MAELVKIEEARLVCRVDGDENDDLIKPILLSAEKYILDYLGLTKDDADSADPRIKRAILALTQIQFRPNEDVQGNLRAHVTALLKQIKVSL